MGNRWRYAKIFFVVASILLLVMATAGSAAFAASFGLRAGIGQFASQAEDIDGKTGNALLFGINLQPKPSFRIDLGVRYNGVSETEVPIESPIAGGFSVSRITRKIGYTGIYGAPGLNIDLSQVGSGVGAYIYIGGGVGFATVVNRVEYADIEATPTYELSSGHDNWKPFWLAGAGVKVQVFYIGVFGEFAYYNGSAVEFGSVSVGTTELLPAETTEPCGFAAYIGLCWN